jgi:hypothetical protein
VLRVCSLVWRQGERVGVRFVSAKELRQGAAPEAAGTPAGAKPQRARAG